MWSEDQYGTKRLVQLLIAYIAHAQSVTVPVRWLHAMRPLAYIPVAWTARNPSHVFYVNTSFEQLQTENSLQAIHPVDQRLLVNVLAANLTVLKERLERSLHSLFAIVSTLTA